MRYKLLKNIPTINRNTIITITICKWYDNIHISHRTENIACNDKCFDMLIKDKWVKEVK